MRKGIAMKKCARQTTAILLGSWALSLALACSALAQGGAPAAARKGGISKATEEKGKVNLDFTDADISDVVKSISEITGKNFILDERVRGKITIISPSPVSVEEAYQAFISALEVKNFTVVRIGKINKVVPKRDAKQMPISTVSDDYRTPYGDAFITRLIPIKYIRAEEIVQSLKSLASPDGLLSAYGPTNTLIVTDSASNIRRLMTIIRRLDKKVFQEQIEVVPLKYANAIDMANKLTQIFPVQKGGAGGAPTTFTTRRRSGSSSDVEGKQIISNIIPDERTNSLIVMANTQGLLQVKQFIAKLDTVLDQPTGKIHVHYLENASAEELSATLSGVAAAGHKGGKGGSPAAPAISNAPPAAGELFGGDIKVTADIPTNALVIISSNQDYEALKPVIYKLDIPRRQVFVEAMILEVTMNPKLNVGFSSVAGGNAGGIGGNTTIFGGLNPMGAIFPDAAGNGGIFGFRGKTIPINIGGKTVDVPIYGAVFNALQTNDVLNVVSTPNIMTMDNKEAEIVVGDRVPFPTSASQPTLTAGAPILQQIQREDVATILRITPQVNESNYVTMDIYQEVSEVTANNPTLGATTSQRKAKTTVVASDGQTIVIGGLIKDKETKGVSKVPLLGDIPLLGWFFRSTINEKKKINLIIYITPHIIHSALDAEKVSRDQNRRMRESIQRAHLKEPEAYKTHPNLQDERFRAPPEHRDRNYEEVVPAPAKPKAEGEQEEGERRSSAESAYGQDSEGTYLSIDRPALPEAGKPAPPKKVKKAPAPGSPFDDVQPPTSE